MRRHIWKAFGALGYVIQYSCIVHCTIEYVADFVLCSGPSMEPTIYSNDVLLAEHVTPRWRNIRRGDIVIAKCPTDPNINICKRIVGLPGDKIRIGLINSEVVPRGHVWLEGDNSSNSSDSRDYGPVPQALIRGRALCKVWPLNDLMLLS